MPQPTRITLVRHGAVANPQRIYYGRLPGFSLSEKGLAEARAAALALKDIPLVALYSSPLLRARQTAREIRRHHPHLPLRQSRLIIEIDTPLQGTPRPPGTAKKNVYRKGLGEQPADILRRGRRFLNRLRRDCAGGHSAAVSHGDVILFLRLWAEDIPATADAKMDIARHDDFSRIPQTGSLTTLTFHTDTDDERPTVDYLKPPRR